MDFPTKREQMNTEPSGKRLLLNHLALQGNVEDRGYKNSSCSTQVSMKF